MLLTSAAALIASAPFAIDRAAAHGGPMSTTSVLSRPLGSPIAAAAPASDLDASVRSVAALSGEPHTVAAAGVTQAEESIVTVENPSAFDPRDPKLRVALIGAADDDARVVVDLVRWFKTRAPRALRSRWSLSALPRARFDAADKQSLTRWTTFQSPDLVVTVGAVSPAVEAPIESITGQNASGAFEKLLAAPRERSDAHRRIAERVQREPLEIARLLARRYPETPSISYIPALSWIGALRLAALDNDPTFRARVVQQTSPWTSGQQALFAPAPPAATAAAGQPGRQGGNAPGARIQLTSVAGTMIFGVLAGDSVAAPVAEDVKTRAAALFDEGVAAASKERAPQEPEYGQGWTDDMFMATAVLARSGARPGHEADLDRAARLLVAYATRLQRPDGLFNHATNGPAAWGRGNGFAAFGLVETLERLPASHPLRGSLLDIFRHQMAAIRAQQSPDGSWREVIDVPGAYREETATAMLMSAMARGIAHQWLDGSYHDSVNRSWRAVAAHVAADGALIDVCTGTGAGPTRRYYLDRAALTGPDDRGGAMALVAALDFSALQRR